MHEFFFDPFNWRKFQDFDHKEISGLVSTMVHFAQDSLVLPTKLFVLANRQFHVKQKKN